MYRSHCPCLESGPGSDATSDYPSVGFPWRLSRANLSQPEPISASSPKRDHDDLASFFLLELPSFSTLIRPTDFILKSWAAAVRLFLDIAQKFVHIARCQRRSALACHFSHAGAAPFLNQYPFYQTDMPDYATGCSNCRPIVVLQPCMVPNRGGLTNSRTFMDAMGVFGIS
jgi:hypothetical protein